MKNPTTQIRSEVVVKLKSISHEIFFSGFLEFNMYKKRLQAFKVLEISKNLFFSPLKYALLA